MPLDIQNTLQLTRTLYFDNNAYMRSRKFEKSTLSQMQTNVLVNFLSVDKIRFQKSWKFAFLIKKCAIPKQKLAKLIIYQFVVRYDFIYYALRM